MEPCLFGFLLVFLRLGGLAGSRPGGRGTFFCFAKRKYPKKRRAEVRAAARFLALLASWGKFANLSAARPSDMRMPDPHAAALLSPATRQRRDRDRTTPLGDRAFTPSPLWGRRSGCGATPAKLPEKMSPLPTSAVMRWRVAQGRADQGCACPKAAQRTSLRRPRPDRATQCARSEAKGQRIRLAFLLLTFLWRSKER